MYTAGFYAGALPVSWGVLGAVFLAVWLTSAARDPLYSYGGTAFVCCTSLAGFKVAQMLCRAVCRRPLLRRLTLPESPTLGLMDTHLFPLGEECVRLLGVYYGIKKYSSGEAWVGHAAVAAAGYAALTLPRHLLVFSPRNYTTHYNRFIDLHQKFLYHVTSGSAKRSVASGASAASDATLVQHYADCQEPIFNMDPFLTMSGAASSIAISPDLLMASSDSDRFYSVSPKDTMYLLCDPLAGQDDVLDNVSESGDSRRPLVSTTEASSPDFGPSGDIAEVQSHNEHTKLIRSKLPAGGNSRLLQGPSAPSQGLVQQLPPARRLAWLLPSMGPKPTPTAGRRHEREVIRKKLSTYTLNSESGLFRSLETRRGYGLVDLEMQSTALKCNSHLYYAFAKYVNRYIDFWSSTLDGMVCLIDPSFVKFGCSIPDLSTAVFIMYLICDILWHFVATMTVAAVLAVPFTAYSAACLVVLAVLKLFRVNYLYSQCTLSYQAAVSADFCINLSCLALALTFYLLH